MKKLQNDFLGLLNCFFSQYLPSVVGVSSNTIKSYKYTFRLLFQFFSSKGVIPDSIDFTDLNQETILSFLDWLENTRNCSRSTRNQRHAALISFSKYAQNRNFDAAACFRNAVIKIPMKKARKKHHPPFTIKEVEILFRLPDVKTKFGFRDQVILCTLYASGARAQEICDLRVCDVSKSDARTVLRITGKGNKTRRVVISENCANLLFEFIRRRRIQNCKEAHIFSSLTHEHMTISCIEEIVKKYVRFAKEKHPDLFRETGYSVHSWRSSVATHMIEAGISIVVIKNFLGHSQITTTQIYCELSQNIVDEQILSWNRKWFNTSFDVKQETDNNLDFLNI